MIINITAENNTITGQGSIVQNVYEAPSHKEMEIISRELAENKKRFKKGSREYAAVEMLEDHVHKNNWSGICNAIKSFSGQFAGATLANLAGSYLVKLFGL